MSSLYEITNDIKELSSLIDALGEDAGEEYENAVKDMESLLSSKVDSCADYLRYLDDLAENAAKRIKELQEYRQARLNKATSFKKYIQLAMNNLQKEIVSGALSTFKLQSKPPLLSIKDEDQVPMEYLESKTTTRVKLAELKAAVKGGLDLREQGIELVEQTEKSLRVTLKK